VSLPPRVRVIERDWLSCNSIVLDDSDHFTVVDSGYASDATDTVGLIRAATGGRPLTRLVNTHCHSDHMGGNAAVREAFGCTVAIPEGEAERIRRWDVADLMLGADQFAPRFAFDCTVAPGDTLRMGGSDWLAIAAPGHDDNALVFHAPETGVLIAGDALWESGFGIVFAALDGDYTAFDRARTTLDAIGVIAPRVVIPGHGKPFGDVTAALERARFKLDGYQQDPVRLARHAAKVLLSFSLMERRAMPLADLPAYVVRVSTLRKLNARFLHMTPDAYAAWLVRDLVQARAIRVEGERIVTTAP